MRQAGKPYGLEFGQVTLLSNSRLALTAGEFARDKACFDEYHDRAFKAYFIEGRDIGDPDVIFDLAESAGLDPEGLKKALNEKRYAPRLEAAREEAAQRFIHAVPTFIIGDDQSVIIGAQPIEIFRRALSKIRQ